MSDQGVDMGSENYSAMVEYAKQKTLRRENEVIKTIEKMKRENITINFSTVAQYSKASKSGSSDVMMG